LDPEEPGREGGAAPTRVFCRGLPRVGGPRVAAVGGGGAGLNWSKTSWGMVRWHERIVKGVYRRDRQHRRRG
jgi:hypothetical protein